MIANKDNDSNFSIVRLKYKKGDLVFKQGDFGLSIYKILEGKIGLFTETDDIEVPLTALGPGSVVGEMIFLNKAESRTASARAIESAVLEVWHPRLLKREYGQMPPVIKYLADHALNKVIRMDKLVVKLTDQKRKKDKGQKFDDPWASKRRYYRKPVKIKFNGRPVRPGTITKISGVIKDISLGGANLELKSLVSPLFHLKLGDELIINVTLPNGNDLELMAKLSSMEDGKSIDSFFLGISFMDLSEYSKKNLGFFLMS